MEEQESLICRYSRSSFSASFSQQLNVEFSDVILQEMYENVIEGNSSRLEVLLGECETLEIINTQNEKGMTLLHYACDKSDPEIVRILLHVGTNPNIVDTLGRTPLHWTLEGRCHCQFCSQNNAKCIELLRESGANLDFEDNKGETALHYAAKNMLPQCAIYLLNNGAKITSTSPRAPNIGYMMVQKIPESVTRILDRGIIFHEADNSKLKLDFGLIAGKTKTFQPVETDEEESCQPKSAETKLLVKMLRAHRSGREILLTHPLVEAFLHLKWLAVRKWFWMVRIAYAILVLIYSGFVFDLYVWSCPYAMNNGTITEFVEDHENPDCLPNLRQLIMAGFITTSLLLMILNEIFEYFNERRMYVSTFLNFGWWTLILLMGLTIFPAFGFKPFLWQYPLASLSLFYAWSMNLVQIGHMPYFGIFVEMLGKVLREFFIFVFTFSSLIIGFTFGFCVMFPQTQFFQKLPLAYVKSLIMMIGEPDYEHLFENNNIMSNMLYSIPAHMLFIGFIFIVTIVLMNLLLGLAISDIQELRKYSTLTRSTRQIQQIALLESFMHSRWLPSCISAVAIRNSSIESILGDSHYLIFAPMDPDDAPLPEILKQKFVPYLTMSPCLIRGANCNASPFGKAYKMKKQTYFSKVAMDAKKRPKEFRQMFILKSLADSMEELKTEVKNISQKLANISGSDAASTEV